MSSNSKSLDAAIATTRFGLGARPGEIAAAMGDPQGWLLAQIRASGADTYAGATSLEAAQAVEQARLKKKAAGEEIRRFYAAAPPREHMGAASATTAMTRAAKKRETSMADASTTMGESGESLSSNGLSTELEAIRKRQHKGRLEGETPVLRELQAQVGARAALAFSTPHSFRERWALFWSNHFTVASKGPENRVLTPIFEREAIRPHVFGRFGDLLVAASTHPAMLIYLNQAQSIGPNSPQALRMVEGGGRAKSRGLNENLAREIMELHTVGADAGYGQADVTEFAKGLTGLGVGAGDDRLEPLGASVFRTARHEPGTRTVMGKRFAEGGNDQALAVLRYLATRPETARHLSLKLAAHFTADAPDPALVTDLERSWIASGGDLAEVARTLVKSPRSWTADAQKLKTPYELLISSYRAAAVLPSDGQREIVRPLALLGQTAFLAPQPNGWSDLGETWAAPDALVKRLTWAQSFSAAYAPDDVGALAREALGARLRPATAQSLARAESRPEALAVLIMSPEFQRR